MNIQGKKVVFRAAAVAALLAGASVVACTTTAEPDTTPGPSTGGSNNPTAGSAGATAAGSSAGGASGAGAGTGKACTATPECPMGQTCNKMVCGCPGYAPNYCAADLKCTSPMKDPDHCGDCTTKCEGMSTCSEGACTPALGAVAEIAGCGTLKLVQAGGKLYALSTMTGALSSVDLAAPGAPTPIATGLTGATAFAVDAMNAYVATGMSITKAPLAGGATSVIVTETKAIADVAVGTGTLYYGTGNEVKSIATTAVNSAPPAVAVALAASEGEPQGVAVSGMLVLYGSASAMNVERCDTTMACHDGEGTDVETRGAGHFKIGQSQGGLIFGHHSVQTDGMKVFWVNNGLQAAPIMPDGTGLYPVKGVATPKDGGGITAYAIKGTTAYFAEQAPGATPSDPPIVNFEKSAFDATDATWIARSLDPVSSIVVDDTTAYLASGCKILKSPL